MVKSITYTALPGIPMIEPGDDLAGLVVAAKGLLRFPELQAAARNDATHVDEVTEYFLVGTFTSLLVALASVVLLA